jgi:hypothetical protein
VPHHPSLEVESAWHVSIDHRPVIRSIIAAGVISGSVLKK